MIRLVHDTPAIFSGKLLESLQKISCNMLNISAIPKCPCVIFGVKNRRFLARQGVHVLSLYCWNGNQNLRERAAANFPVCTSKVSYAHAQKWSVPKRVAIFEILILNNHAQLCAAVACKLFFNAIKESKKPNALDEATLGFAIQGSNPVQMQRIDAYVEKLKQETL